MKIDTHVHSKFSSDCSTELREIVEHAKSIGLDGVCITDHNFLVPNVRRQIEALTDRNLLVLCGMEYHTNHGHMLTFGLRANPFHQKYKPIQQVINWVNKHGAAIIPAHPYEEGYTHTLGDYVFSLRGLVALETQNGAKSRELNDKAEQARQKLGLKGIGGSDAHCAEQVGRRFTIFENKITNMDDLVRELKEGRYHAGMA